MHPSTRPWFIRQARPLLLVGVVLVALAALGVILLVVRAGDAEAWVTHTYEVRGVGQSLLSDILESESSVRGFALTGDDAYLARYSQSSPLILPTLDRLRVLTMDNPDERQRLDSLKSLLDEQLARLSDFVARKRAAQSAEPAVPRSNRGEIVMTSIAATLNGLEQEESNLLAKRQQDWHALQLWLLALIAISLVGAIALAGGLALGTQYYIQRLRERTRELQAEAALRQQAEATLRQSLKLEAIGQLTGGIAHDFNNLLTIVLGNLDTLKRRLAAIGADGSLVPSRDSFVGLLEIAMRGARSAAQLTHRLLAFARRQSLEPARCDLNRLVSSMSDLLRRTLGETINIETVLAAGLWPTFADANQLENALLNLAINARDAMPDGGRLTVETGNAYLDDAYAARFGDVEPGQYVQLSVTDTGTGIAPELMEKVFEPFFTTKGHGEGSGLGLAMVHGFVKQSGGHVRIYSEVGQGTTVKIYLPRLMEEEHSVAAPAERINPLELTAFAARPGEAILVVEDNPGVRSYAHDALSDLGYRVHEASDAAAALAIAQGSARIDLLFTDVVLPGERNGRELAEQIRQQRPETVVLFTTGYTRNAIVHQGRLDAGVNLIGKPYTQDDIGRKVRELLDSKAKRSTGDGA